MYTHQADRKPALQQNWQSSEKSHNFQEKTQFLMNTLYKVTWPFMIFHELTFNILLDALIKFLDAERQIKFILPERLSMAHGGR